MLVILVTCVAKQRASAEGLMYNLLIGFAPGVALGGRILEYTEPHVVEYVKPPAGLDLARLSGLPTLVMPEVGFDEPQVAQVGHVTDLAWVGGNLHFRFVPNGTVPPIPSSRVEELASRLGIADWEFHRTHWAVKAADLYGALAGAEPDASASRAFRLPRELARDPELVAVMMPFDASLSPVYDALRSAIERVGLRCHRADDIWENAHIMDDVISLIWRARVVISDLTGKNPNVFYETGIAHTLGRDVIQIAQHLDDVPFDLRSIRTLRYLNNGEGLGRLADDTAERLLTLIGRRP